MKFNRCTLSLTIAATLTAALPVNSQAAIIDMNYDGLVTILDPSGSIISNSSMPYYYDPAWDYGRRTQISGTFQYDTDSNSGSATINSFEFLNGGPAVISDFDLKSAGGDLLIGNFHFNWNGNDVTTQIVLDASGLFSELASDLSVNDTIDQSNCTSSGACATPASNDISNGKVPIGPVPIASSSYNTTGQTGFGSTLAQLSLGADDGIGGSPWDHGFFEGVSMNIDITTMTSNIVVDPIPVPAAVWLFGSGLLGLIGVARRR